MKPGHDDRAVLAGRVTRDLELGAGGARPAPRPGPVRPAGGVPGAARRSPPDVRPGPGVPGRAGRVHRGGTAPGRGRLPVSGVPRVVRGQRVRTRPQQAEVRGGGPGGVHTAAEYDGPGRERAAACVGGGPAEGGPAGGGRPHLPSRGVRRPTAIRRPSTAPPARRQRGRILFGPLARSSAWCPLPGGRPSAPRPASRRPPIPDHTDRPGLESGAISGYRPPASCYDVFVGSRHRWGHETRPAVPRPTGQTMARREDAPAGPLRGR